MYTEEKLIHNTLLSPELPSAQGVLPLSTLSTGSHALVQNIRGRDEAKTFLENLGLVANTKISIVSKVGGSVIVNVKGSKIAISKALAAKVMAAPL